MNNFKVGDRVQIISSRANKVYGSDTHIGKYGTVTGFTSETVMVRPHDSILNFSYDPRDLYLLKIAIGTKVGIKGTDLVGRFTSSVTHIWKNEAGAEAYSVEGNIDIFAADRIIEVVPPDRTPKVNEVWRYENTSSPFNGSYYHVIYLTGRGLRFVNVKTGTAWNADGLADPHILKSFRYAAESPKHAFELGLL
jgi:hypothetical protein